MSTNYIEMQEKPLVQTQSHTHSTLSGEKRLLQPFSGSPFNSDNVILGLLVKGCMKETIDSLITKNYMNSAYRFKKNKPCCKLSFGPARAV